MITRENKWLRGRKWSKKTIKELEKKEAFIMPYIKVTKKEVKKLYPNKGGLNNGK